MTTPLIYDPYRVELRNDPYPTYKRMRDEAPLYYNEEYDFYAVSRFDDVERGLGDRETYVSSRGDILEMIKGATSFPPGMFIMEDPPIHTAHRGIVQKVFTPKRVNVLEAKIREFCARALDPLIGTDRFDFITHLGAEMPMRVIGMLLGIPEEDLVKVRQMADTAMATEAGKPMQLKDSSYTGSGFEEYIDWRYKHPSDDLMTDLINTEFKDGHGVVRKLTRDEVVAMTAMIAGAGNETTNRLIGWTGKVLAEHPDQRREIAKNPALIPAAIEELLRFEPPGPQIARYMVRDAEIHGRKVPAGSAMLFIIAAANRDERRYEDGERFNIHRHMKPHMVFGYGIHSCIGSALARMEGRVALEEVMKRFTDWEVDYDNAVLSSTSTVRGWDTLPVYTRPSGKSPRKAETAAAPPPKPSGAVDVEGTWNVVVKGPTGPQPTVLVIQRVNGQLAGTQTGDGMTSPITDVKLEGNNLTWVNHITKPMKLKVTFITTIDGNTMSGKCKPGFLGSYALTAVKAG
jgi:cytochrome P450